MHWVCGWFGLINTKYRCLSIGENGATGSFMTTLFSPTNKETKNEETLIGIDDGDFYCNNSLCNGTAIQQNQRTETPARNNATKDSEDR